MSSETTFSGYTARRTKEAAVFTLSIEPTGGKSFVHGFHLGTDEAVAMREAETRFRGRNAAGKPTATVALIRDHHLYAVYDGTWSFFTKRSTKQED